jgi:hypothetical protein
MKSQLLDNLRLLVSGLCLLSATPVAACAAAPAISTQLAEFAATRNAGLPPPALEFTRATVVATPAPVPESKAVQVLVEEVERRTLVCWPVVAQAEETDSALELSWKREPGPGDNGRGLVAEVWLRKKT